METFEDGAHVTRYVEQGPGAPHNSALAQLGSGAMLQVCCAHDAAPIRH